MNDDDVLATVKDSLAGVRMDRPLQTVVARGRGHRRQRRAAGAGTLVLAAGLVVAAAGGLGGTAPPAGSDNVTVRPAAWSVTGNEDGTITVVLRRPQELTDPAALQRALTAADAPAIVKVGDCQWPSPRDDYAGGYSMSRSHGIETIRITPSKMPPGSLVVFAIHERPPLVTNTGETVRTVSVASGVMAPGGTVTCQR